MSENLEAGRGVVHDEGRVGDWMQTWTGKRFYLLDPRPEDVDILDIAYALGNITRYGGHCRFYSVAEHSILISRIVPPEDALEGLLHDATEAYVGDVVRPVKRALRALAPGHEESAFAIIERRVRERAIMPKFGLRREPPPSVKEADSYQIVALEKGALHSRSQAWDLGGRLAPEGVRISCYPPDSAGYHFLLRFLELSRAAVSVHRDLTLRWFALHDEDALCLRGSRQLSDGMR